jgi:hemerythrin-like domain-containing protein
MDAVETLLNEHRTIERVLDALVAFADETRRRGATEKEELGRFVLFFAEFADALHHGKEEDVLFEAMTAAGFPREGGPVAVMLREHDHGRALVGALRGFAARDGAWSGTDAQAIADAARAFSDLLHAHIHKEDAILYPMAESHVPAAAMVEVGRRCAAIDRDRAADADRLAVLADELVSRHGVLSPRALRAGGA